MFQGQVLEQTIIETWPGFSDGEPAHAGFVRLGSTITPKLN